MHDQDMIASVVIRARRSFWFTVLSVIVASGSAAACSGGSGDTELPLPTSDAALEAAARRADSMVAAIAVGQALADTMSRIAAGELSASVLARLAAGDSQAVVPPTPRAGTGQGMTERARARGDSLARAAAVAYARDNEPSADRSRSDSLRGIVVIEGTAPMNRLALRSRSVASPVALSGMATSELMGLQGLEVVVRGVRSGPRDLVVTSFVVRAAAGVPVQDGILSNENNRWSLQLTDGGRVALERIPATLQSHVGERVWIATSGNASRSSGVISVGR